MDPAPGPKPNTSHRRWLIAVAVVLLLLLAWGITIAIAYQRSKPLPANQYRASIAQTGTVSLDGCQPQYGTWSWALGSVGFRVVGWRGNACRVTIHDEMEMGFTNYTCDFPRSVQQLQVTQSTGLYRVQYSFNYADYCRS